jgi:rhodanese-related sulfurtransferase
MRAIGRIGMLAALVVGAACHAPAQADVVADSACPRQAVDIASFASCDGAHVARADGIAFVTPQAASHMKQLQAADTVLLDVRSRLEASINGIATQVDALVPYQEPSLPLHWDDGSTEAAQARNASFVAVVQATVLAGGGSLDSTLILLCRDGVLALRAAEELHAAGFAHVNVVEGGFEGQVDSEQHRSGGWKQAQLPWTAQVTPALLFGPAE